MKHKKHNDLVAIDGTYAALVPTAASAIKLLEWAKSAYIIADPHPHVTVLYSHKHVETHPTTNKHLAVPDGFILLGDFLVLKLKAPSIVNRHNELIALGGTHDYPVFTPHLTILAQPNGIKIEDLPPIDFHLIFENEYHTILVG
jgi:hypothetical protein